MHYRDGERRHEGPLELDDAAALAGDGFVWIGLHEPAPDELRAVAERFALPPLAVEDAMLAHQRPKLEDYRDSCFVVLRTARYVDEREVVEFGEIHVFAGAGHVIVVRHGATDDPRAARERLEQRPELLREGPATAIWAIMDEVVDGYEPVMAGLENDVEEVEAAVFGERSDETRRVYFLRRELAAFYRAVRPLLTALDELGSAERPNVSASLREHLRDVADHVKRVEEGIATQRELLASVLQANLAVISVRQNEVVKQISGWAAIIATPTLIASVYGMNFEHMPELGLRFGYPACMFAMLVVALVLHRVLRRAGWL